MEILVGNLCDKRESFSNRWLKVDTSCLFMDQYNTTEDCGNLRILDKDVIAVRGDIRKDYCRCGYCGKVFKVGEEEKHFKEMENSKDCNSCWYFKDEREYEHKPELKEIIQREDGTFDEVFTKVMICHHSAKNALLTMAVKCSNVVNIKLNISVTVILFSILMADSIGESKMAQYQ